MIILCVFLIVVTFTIIAILRSGKPVKHICAEIKIELIYNYLGTKSMFEDMIMKRKNKTELVESNKKVAIVTGGSRGIGTDIVRKLVQCNMHVIIGCRNVSAGKELETLIRKEGVETGEIETFELDTGSLKSVRKFSEAVKEKFQFVHILVNNAGIMFGPQRETEDGYESQFAVNYLGHFLLTHLLMPQLKAAGCESDTKARIVNVSSIAHFSTDINFDDINCRNQFITSQCYGQSKLAQVMFTMYLQKILSEAGVPVQVYAVHPGIVNTDLFNETPLKSIFPWLPALVFKTPAEGATSIVHACISPKLEGEGGTYISNCKIAAVSSYAKSVEMQQKLFEMTLKLLNIEEFGKVSD